MADGIVYTEDAYEGAEDDDGATSQGGTRQTHRPAPTPPRAEGPAKPPPPKPAPPRRQSDAQETGATGSDPPPVNRQRSETQQRQYKPTVIGMTATPEGEAPRPVGRESVCCAPKVACILAYIFGLVTGIYILVVEKKNLYVRFHGLQGLVLFGIMFVVILFLGIIDAVAGAQGILTALASLVYIVIIVIMCVKAWKLQPSGVLFKLPLIGVKLEELAKNGVGGERPPQEWGAQDTAHDYSYE